MSRFNMKVEPIRGICGGRSRQNCVPTIGTLSKMISLKCLLMWSRVFFGKIFRLQQKDDVKEYTYEWEALATWILELKDTKKIYTYVYGIKPYIRYEL